MLSFRRRSTIAAGGKGDAVSPPLPQSAIKEAKEAERADDDDVGDLFSAVLSSARSSSQQSPVMVDERIKESAMVDEEKSGDGKRVLPPPPLPYDERKLLSPPSLPSLSKPEITPDTLRALTAVHSADKEGAADEAKNAAQQPLHHERKTSSSALIAEILGNKGISVPSAANASLSSASSITMAPPPLLSGASMAIDVQPRKELPRISMREVYGEVDYPTPIAPPPTPAANTLSQSPPPPHRPPPPSPAHVPPPFPNTPSNPFAADTPSSPHAPPPSAPRPPPAPSPSSHPRSPPPRPLPPASAAPPPFAPPLSPVVSDEGVPSAPVLQRPAEAVVGVNPFDDDEGAREGVVVVVAVAAYSASAADQLSCAKGESLDVVDGSHPGWTLVRNARGMSGLIPASYVRKWRKEDAEGASAAAAMPPPAPRQLSVTSHRRTASQPASLPTPPSSSPASHVRLPPASPSSTAAVSPLRLQPPPSPASRPVPPTLPRPLSIPTAAGGAACASPNALSPPPVVSRPRAPSVPMTPVARRPLALPTSASFSSTPEAAVSGAAVTAMEVCEAAHSYAALAADQLSMTAGEKLLLVDRHHPHWWKVVNGSGETGLVPTTYIKLMEAPTPTASSYSPHSRPPPNPPAQSNIRSPPALSVPAPPSPLPQNSHSLPSPTVAALQPSSSPPHPARQIQQQLVITPTAASQTPQHRHSMSLNTISAPFKPAPPAALTAASAPPTPISARTAAVDPPSFPLPPNAAARNSPLPSPSARPPPPTAAATAAVGVAAVVGSGALVAERGEAVHSFDATDGVQLSVSRGDALIIMQRLDTGWAMCRLLHTGITGLVPTSYVRSTTERLPVG